MLLGILNDAVRVFIYQRFLPEIRAHQLSSLSGMALLGIAVFYINRQWPVGSPRHALTIGAFWLLLTVSFKTGFGHFIMKSPPERLLSDYRLDRGRMWPLMLLWLFFAPLVMTLYL